MFCLRFNDSCISDDGGSCWDVVVRPLKGSIVRSPILFVILFLCCVDPLQIFPSLRCQKNYVWP